MLSTFDNNPVVDLELQNIASTFLLEPRLANMHITQTDDLVVMPFELITQNHLQFVVVLQDSISAWLQTRNLFMLELLPFFIVGILLALLGSFFIARSITRPVGRLLKAAKLVASGSYAEHIKVSEKSELGELAREFTNMQTAVMEREQKIKDQAEEIRQTNKIKYQVELAQKEQQLAASATEAKSRFLANVSHEIRTPLNSIIGYSEILSDATVSQEDKLKATSAINNGGQYLLNIVNDVLDLAKIEAGKIQLTKIDIGLLDLLHEVSAYMQGFALEKHLKFNLTLHYPLPYEFNTDATRLKQILLNLCNNGIKFTEQGSVDLHVHLDTLRRRFIFVISDTGSGMSDEQQLRLFTAFTQGNQSSSRKYGGTGLGLYISKQLTEMLGGHIKVTSQEGEGSQFAVYMPWVEASNKKMLTSKQETQQYIKQKHIQQKSQSELNVPQLRAHILCADDNDDNRQLVAYLIHKTGAKLTLVNDGVEAVTATQVTHFDLILMDMQMPEMDGIHATEAIVKNGFNGPIIMLTANVDSTSKKQIMQAGAKEHFSKPIHTESFYQMLDKYLGETSSLSENDILGTEPVSSEFEQLIENYRASFANKLAIIDVALKNENWPEIKALMHNLKGSAGSYGFQVLSDLAKLVEEHIELENYLEVEKYLRDLRLCMEQLQQVTEYDE
ncbi:ATP-binding protein [Paraglaciecola aquimarina]|uniref:histidine kinase n=1 Tax=Paraglaciecola aquimarina TaxID=1235557 RepID=A0ABU3SRX9_9ALTE|nr:ATP-binding protein [Paraglaciecola aquimarina]MDU0352775.1 ATP-binding protein [Paraglaciecola aquimarina]